MNRMGKLTNVQLHSPIRSHQNFLGICATAGVLLGQTRLESLAVTNQWCDGSWVVSPGTTVNTADWGSPTNLAFSELL